MKRVVTEQLMPNWLQKRASLSPDRTAIEIGKRAVTFGQLYDQSIDYAARLYSKGVRPFHRVGILQQNSLNLVTALHALMQTGVEIVFYNIRLSPLELAYQFSDAHIDWLITEEEFLNTVVESGFDGEKTIIFNDLFSTQPSSAFVPVEVFNLEHTATIMYTSGTSGHPKGVMQTYGNHWWSAVGSMLNLRLHEGDKWLCAVPLFHISGLSILMRSIIYGMTVQIHPHFDEKIVNKAIKEEGITIMSMVANMLNRMVADLGEDGQYPPSFRCALLGGGPAPYSILEACKTKKIPVYQTYGMTETASQIVTLSPEHSLEKLGSAGKALFPCSLKIVADGKELQPMETGEILLQGPNVTKGYLNREQETESAFSDGWLHTGDLGYVDEEGFLFVVDRRSDLIISGGENVYPAEVESALMRHEHIFEAGVTGAPDDKWGQVPIAFIVTNNKEITEQDVKVFCKDCLASYKVPKEVYFVESLPRNASNKLLRRELLKFRK
ncbi:o-succinylbenzoate--CoA ligase [Bacillus sp. 1P06AnD]|uniref:o-succinylbenzoate--CoA ligase n=1 Tax=Bacillus sp. 1P06AnD TaxID=3132208 RepID=UPI0039A26FED